MDDDVTVGAVRPASPHPVAIAPPFIAPDILHKADIPRTRQRLRRIIDTEIVPRLIAMQAERDGHTERHGPHPAEAEIAALASRLLDPGSQLAPGFLRDLETRGFTMEDIFVHMLEPAARVMGEMWERDECDFIDVALGVGRLQQLMSTISRASSSPALVAHQKVCMMTLADERHSLGVSMIETLLRAAGWEVQSERGATLREVEAVMKAEWYAVVGLAVSSDRQLDSVAATIRTIRRHARNPSLGIMVGGAPFSARPALAAEVGADATALNAASAVLLARKLFDRSVSQCGLALAHA